MADPTMTDPTPSPTPPVEATDDAPSSSALVLAGLLISLVALLLVGVIVAVGPGAGGDDTANDSRAATAGLPDLQQQLAEPLWVLDRADSSVNTRDENPVSLQFGDDTLSGLGPCNAYWGRYHLDQDQMSLQVTRLRHTERECSAGTMRAEREYFAALRSVRDIDLDDRDHLILTNGVGDRLAFDSHDAYDVLARDWRITAVGGDDALEPPVAGTRPTASFEVGGDLHVDTGCNTLSSSWALSGDALTTGTARQTLRLCEDPAGLLEQEAFLGRVFDSGVRVHQAPGRLLLLDRFHRVLLVAVPARSSSAG